MLGQADGYEVAWTAARVKQVEGLLNAFAERDSAGLQATLAEIAGAIASHQGKPLRAMWLPES